MDELRGLVIIFNNYTGECGFINEVVVFTCKLMHFVNLINFRIYT